VDDELTQVRRKLERVRTENVRLSRLLDLRGQNTAPPDRVFAALTDSDALAVWLPPGG
jgi:uncharacterized protein YndB with AHSA1/START domain